LTTPVDDLVSNWAYMVMASLAWVLKAWSAHRFQGVNNLYISGALLQFSGE
jgi:hypothetical protein